MAQNNLLAYPDFNKQLHINNVSNDFQLGMFIIQEGITIALYSRNLDRPQTRYIVTENRLLINVEVLNVFCTITLGQQLKIYTLFKTCDFLLQTFYQDKY